ncbi:hypothetical protein, partial [Listeria monocytogenes]|uniref:hypothetical protein n=1 Tax=Listeria monocytogenes TaxID=1639 RepID=UPI002FDBC400
ETAKAAQVSKQWQDYARSSDDDHAKEIARIRTVANAAGGVRFTDPGRRPGGGCPAADTRSAGTPKDNAAGGQLSGEAAAFLRGEALRADEVA